VGAERGPRLTTFTYIGMGEKRARGERPVSLALTDAALARGGTGGAVSQAGGVQAGAGSTAAHGRTRHTADRGPRKPMGCGFARRRLASADPTGAETVRRGMARCLGSIVTSAGKFRIFGPTQSGIT
jgi:hypothetical protein